MQLFVIISMLYGSDANVCILWEVTIVLETNLNIKLQSNYFYSLSKFYLTLLNVKVTFTCGYVTFLYGYVNFFLV